MHAANNCNHLPTGIPCKARLEQAINSIVPKNNDWFFDNVQLTTYYHRCNTMGRISVGLDLGKMSLDFAVVFDASKLVEEITEKGLVLFYDI